MDKKVKFRGKPIIDTELMEPGEGLKEFFCRRYDCSEQTADVFTNDGFVVGQVVYRGDSAWIVGQVVDVGEEYIALEYWIPVIPETVGEYTGIKDKNGVRVFVGDVVSYSNCVGDYQGIVRLGEYEQDGSSNVYRPSKCNGFFVERTAPILQKWEDDPDRYMYYMYAWGKTVSLLEVKNLEVVGNIYVNQGLPKTTTDEVLNETQTKVIEAVLLERKRQDAIWGEQNHPPHYWTGILGEEYGELCEAINETVFDNGSDRGGYENMRAEAIHVAAVAIGFLECLERNKALWFPEVPQDDQCVSCGAYVPEGRMICPTCERNPSHVLHKKGV